MTTPKRTPRQTWEALEQQERDDEIDRFLAMSREEVDARLRAKGYDPDSVRKEGEALGKRLLASLPPPPRDAR
jgi:hypothetical protein